MAAQLSRVVGKPLSGGESINKPPDVILVKRLLNQVSWVDGGTKESPLGESALCDKPVLNAIRKFQLKHFGAATGRIEPDNVTFGKLIELSSGQWPANVPRAFSGPFCSALVAHARQRIVEIAGAEADLRRVPPLVDGQPKRKPEEARRLKEYFSAYPDFRKDDSVYLTKLPDGTHWCGVFAVWVLRQVGIDVKWIYRLGIHSNVDGKKLPYLTDSDYSIGDIGLVKENPNEASPSHHFIIAGEPDDKGGMPTIEGNFWGGGVVRHRRATGPYTYYAVLAPRSL